MTHSQVHFKRRVLVSNEQFDAWPAGLPRRVEGVCVGVGATHLWTLAAHAGSSAIVGCDRSESVRMQNEMFARLLHSSPNRYVCLQRWLSRADLSAPWSKAQLRETVISLAANEQEQLGFTELLWRHAFFGTSLCYSGPTLGDHLRSPLHPLSSDAAFAHLHGMPTQFSTTDIRDLSLDRAGLFYFSNVGDYVRPAAALADKLASWNAIAVTANATAATQQLEVRQWGDFCAWLRGPARRSPSVDPGRLWRAYDDAAFLPEDMRDELLVVAFDGAAALAEDRHLAAARALTPAQQLHIARVRREAGLPFSLPADAPHAPLEDWAPLLDQAPGEVLALFASSPHVADRMRAAAVLPQRLISDDDETVRSEAAAALLLRGQPFSDWQRVHLDGQRLVGVMTDELLRHLMEREGISTVHMWPDWLLACAKPLPGLSPGVDEFVTPMSLAERAERLLTLTDPARALGCANALALGLGYYA